MQARINIQSFHILCQKHAAHHSVMDFADQASESILNTKTIAPIHFPTLYSQQDTPIFSRYQVHNWQFRITIKQLTLHSSAKHTSHAKNATWE